MKQNIKKWATCILLVLLSVYCLSQDAPNKKIPKWVPDKGYWIIESNIHSPSDHIIWFYTNDKQLVYKEDLNGIRLNIAKRKIRMKLKKVLDASIALWEQKKITEENKDYVTAILN